MDLEAAFPYRVFTNLPARTDRRERMTARLAALDLSAEHFPAMAADAVGTDLRGFKTLAHRAHAATIERILDEAIARDAGAVLIMEDDVVFAPDFREKVAALTLPRDWGMCYLGCQHFRAPERVAPGLVRVSQAFDTHAYAIRRTCYEAVRYAVRVVSSDCVDVRISDLHRVVPTYAAFPNLAWQEASWSDISQGSYSNYHANGRQKLFEEAVAALQ